jgi:hypothetical protein
MAIVRPTMSARLPDGYVEATWVGPYPAQILQHDGVLVDATPGETVCVVTAGEAKSSDHWKPVRPEPPAKTAKGDE